MKPLANEYEDDFTRLSRLENSINDFIKRHTKLSIELNDIEKNLELILKEFNEEFQDSISKSDNRHTQEIGLRILDKLNNFSTIENSIMAKTNQNINNSNNNHHNHNNNNNEHENHNNEAAILSPNLSKTHQTTTNNEYAHVSDSNHYAKSKKPKQRKQKYHPSPLVNSHSAYLNQDIQDSSINLNGMDKSNEKNEPAQLVKAHYALVNPSTLYSTDTVNRLTHYKSTPSLVQANQGMLFDDYSQAKYTSVDDSFLNDSSQSRMYINMSMVMHSDHPVIEHCFRRIEILRPRIMGYKSDHKLSVYKELDTEIIHLMNRLNSVDCGNDVIFQQNKNIALCELHNLAGVLERAIDCVDSECVICNSFIYRQEVSV